jgi:hypothetical protein
MPQAPSQTAIQVPTRPLEGPANWKSAEIAGRTSEWFLQLGDSDVSDIDAAFRAWKTQNRPLESMTKEDFPAQRFARIAERALDMLENGPGFFLLRGFPVEKYSKDDARALYWGLGRHLGTAISQSDEGDYLGDVRDIRVPQDSPRFRGYKTAGKLTFHCDTADATGLFVLRAAKSGGRSLVCSSVAIHNEIMRTRPDLLEVLYQPFAWSMQGQERPGESKWYFQPLFTLQDGHFSCRYVRGHIRNGQRFEDAPRITARQIEALDYFDSLGERPEFHFITDFQPGDLQLINNHTGLHARTAFEDHAEDDRKRHLLRMWLSVPNSRPLSPLLGRIYRDQRAGAVRGGFPSKIPGKMVFETSERWENEMTSTH